MIDEHKKGVKAMKYTAKPRNFVAKNMTTSGAGAHKDKKKADKQGDTKHKNRDTAMAESFNPEYDDEAGMSHNSIHTIMRAVKGLEATIKEGDNLPEWCQEKLSIAEDYLVTVWDYLQSENVHGSDVNEDVDGSADIDRLLSDIEKTIHQKQLKGKDALHQLRVSLLDLALNRVGRERRREYEPHVMNVNSWDDAREFLVTTFRDATEQGVAEGEGNVEIGQQMANDGITYSPEKENELIDLMAQYMKKSGMSSKSIRYYLSYDEDYISDQLSYLPKKGQQGVSESNWYELRLQTMLESKLK